MANERETWSCLARGDLNKGLVRRENVKEVKVLGRAGLGSMSINFSCFDVGFGVAVPES